MNKEDFDIFRHLRASRPNTALDLINGLKERKYGQFKGSTKGKENMELFAEEQLVGKQELNEMRCEMPGLPRSTFLMVFSPDGSRVASTHGNHNIYVTDIRSGKNIKTLIGHPRTPWCIAFHPTSNQIVASGCLGGQVRIWDLSGGSEVWTTANQSVIASIAFHPNDRVLVIATYNEVYFWDWSQPEPFVHVATSNPKEKVRYVAFDKIGHKLITGIANSPQTRWERVRAPVPVPRQEPCASPYRRRITQRLVNTMTLPQMSSSVSENNTPAREPLSGVPERERRITVCYRNLVREYEQLVHRYLQLYRPPTMIDRGTDPMEPNSLNSSGTQTPEPSTSGMSVAGPSTSANVSTDSVQGGPIRNEQDTQDHSNNSESLINQNNSDTQQLPSRFQIMYSQLQNSESADSQPSTSSQGLITPSRIFCVVKKPNTLIRGTQTSESRKHKADQSLPESSGEKKFKNNTNRIGEGSSSNYNNQLNVSAEQSPRPEQGASRDSSVTADNDQHSETPTQTQSPGRVLIVSLQRLRPENIPLTGLQGEQDGIQPDNTQPTSSGLRIMCHRRDFEDDLLWVSGAPQTDRVQLGLDEFIRLNRQRLAAIHRRRRYRNNNSVTSNSLQNFTIQVPRRSSVDEQLTTNHSENPLNNSESQFYHLESQPGDVDHRNSSVEFNPSTGQDVERPSTSNDPGRCTHNPCNRQNQRNVDELLSNIRRTAEEEVRNRILPIIRSVPANDRPELLRLFENSREHVRFRQMCSVILKKSNRRPVVTDSSSSSSSDDEHNVSSARLTRGSSEPASHVSTPAVTTSESICNNAASSSSPNISTAPSVSTASTSGAPQVGRIRVRNFNTELEQLVTSLLTEIERNDTDGTENNSTANDNTSNNRSSLDMNATTSTSSARTRPSRFQPAASADPQEVSDSTTNTDSLENLLFQEMLQNAQNLEGDNSAVGGSSAAPTPSNTETPATIVNTNTRTTNSTIYTSNTVPRRSCCSHRVSAFMPTRVNYTRTPRRLLRRNTHYPWGRGRSGPRLGSGSNPSFALDELINYSERENSEDDPPPSQWNFHPFDPPPEFPTINPENIGIGNMYSNIVQDLESSLNDVRNIRASNRPGETSDMLSSFSERLENIMNQSDTILRNLRSSMDMLPATTEASRSQETEPSWNFNDQGFYVRDLRTDPANSEPSTSEGINLQDLFTPFRAVAADHTYPRNPNNPTQTDNMSPLMTSLHLTISHIQRQARLLRQQVESIERIDRAMVEVAQLQLVRQLIIELVRHIQTMSGESRSTGMSSVRQMMAGTRISDSSPYDSPSEDHPSSNNGPEPLNLSTSGSHMESNAQPSTSSGTSNTDQPNTNNSSHSRPRTSNRKTYPPSRLFRLARHCQRRPSIVHWFSRRCLNRFERGMRQSSYTSSSNRVPQEPSHSLDSQGIFNYSVINSSTLSLMTRRLEHLLTDQMRVFTRSQETPQTNRSIPAIHLGERILALRLQGCLLRMNRVIHATAAVTQDGAPRYGARHTLSLIVDGLSRHMEELGSSNIQQSMRMQIHGVLAMSLLLTELLLLQVVDSIPPPAGMNLDLERESLTSRIDEMCTQMLRSRFSGNSHQLTTSLRLMRQTMRRAYRALDHTYNARRNAIMPHQETDRRQLLGSINRCLRTIHRERQGTNSSQPGPSRESTTVEESDSVRPSTSSANDNEAWYSTITDLITRYSENRDDESNSQLPNSTTADQGPNRDTVSSNNNSDDNEDEPEWYRNNNSTSHNSNLYRTNNVNLVQNSESSNPMRPWNVPSVHVNDVPISEPTPHAQRMISQRQRFAERVSELRANPTMGLFRPRFLHPLYASVNPFDADLDDPQREQIYDSDMITTVTPNHRIQAWDISSWNVPIISNSMKNIVVSECKIHNDASVDVAKDGTILVTLLPSGGYLNVTNRLGVYSLRWETLGQCLYTTSFEQNAVSVSLSPLSRHLVVGLASRRVSIVPSDRWVMARIFRIEQKDVPGDRLPVLRELEQSRESRINCIRWLPVSGQGLIYATNTGQLVILS